MDSKLSPKVLMLLLKVKFNILVKLKEIHVILSKGYCVAY